MTYSFLGHLLDSSHCLVVLSLVIGNGHHQPMMSHWNMSILIFSSGLQILLHIQSPSEQGKKEAWILKFVVHNKLLRFPLSRSLLALRQSSSTGSNTPPPDYTSCEDVRGRSITLSLNPQVNTSSALSSPSQSVEPTVSTPSSLTGDDCVGHEDEHGGLEGKDGAVATQSIPLLSHRNSVSISSRQSSVDTLKRSRDFKTAEEVRFQLVFQLL